MQKQLVSLAGVLALLGALSSPAQAFTYAEATGDSGETLATAQSILPAGADTAISAVTGNIGSAGGTSGVDDADLYGIFLTANVQFTATVTSVGFSNGGVADTTLSIFGADGTGIFFNDDIAPLNSLSTLTFTPTQSGFYYVGISNYGYFAKDASNLLIFPDTTSLTGPDPTGQYGPNSGVGSLSSWGAGSLGPQGDKGTYTINLTGATAVPEPATGCFFAGFALLGLRNPSRRKKA
jgi:hypothetical protein